MSLNLYYTGGSAGTFAEEMEKRGIAGRIRRKESDLQYEYFFPSNDLETVLFIGDWESLEAFDKHHVCYD